MNYCKIDPYDIANGPGIRVSLWVSGCVHHCKGCFNPETWNFNYGELYTDQTKDKILELINKPYISGLSILGGDPLCQNWFDIQQLTYLCIKVHELNKTIWLWSGYKYEELPKNNFSSSFINNYIDVLVDGAYVETLRDISLPYCGSSNQRVIDISETVKKGEIILWQQT